MKVSRSTRSTGAPVWRSERVNQGIPCVVRDGSSRFRTNIEFSGVFYQRGLCQPRLNGDADGSLSGHPPGEKRF